jgi:hypothetical protein
MGLALKKAKGIGRWLSMMIFFHLMYITGIYFRADSVG